jgi:DNA invertase Pin-like site-specific DNA recombinase
MTPRVVIYARQSGTQTGPLADLRQAVEGRGAIVVATYIDDGNLTGRGKYAGWRTLIAHLDAVDQIAIPGAGDIPGKAVPDLLRTLGILRDHGVGLYVHHEGIDTASTNFALLDIITAYREAKLSQAIRNGQAKALAAGKRIGRPVVPRRVKDRIRAALAQGGGVRSTARQFNVSPASVINIRRTMTVAQCTSC